MKTPLLTLALLSLVLSGGSQTTAPAPTAPTAPAKPAVVMPPQKAWVAAQKFGKDGKVNPGFLAAHEKYVAQAKEGKARLVFLGDSITAGWTRQPAIWEKAFGAYDPVNFGIGGDRTQHVLWRIENGELEVIKPKAVVLMIGTNNAGADSAEDIAKGITAIVDTIKAKQPQAKILLLAVFPRGEKPTGKMGAAHEKMKQVNAAIAKLDDGKTVHYLDIGGKFPVVDGNLSAAVMPDFVHLSESGYQIWADAIGPKLAELMK
jgi:lysophospholipase L1-like esterase